MQSSIPSTTQTCRVSHPLPGRAGTERQRLVTPSLSQCSARAAQDIWEHHRPAVGSSMHALGSVHSTSEKLNSGLSGDPRHVSAPRPGPHDGGVVEPHTPPRTRRGQRPPPAGHHPTKCEPEASGRQISHSLSESTRQITPPIRSGHAPPSTESRKSSQSVHPGRVLTW